MSETTDKIQGAGANRITLYCPTSVAVTQKYLNAPRINTFEGKRIGLLWNGKSNGDFFLKRVGELLEKKYKSIRVTRFWEVDPRGSAHPDQKTDEALDYIARNSDIVISAIAD